jgi:hypothetical protein
MPVSVADLLERYRRDGDSLAPCVVALDRPLPEAVGELLEEAARRWRT